MTLPPLASDQGLPEAAPPVAPLVKRYAGIIRVTHWLNAIFLTGMVASGLAPKSADQWISMPPFTSITAPVM